MKQDNTEAIFSWLAVILFVALLSIQIIFH